MKISPRRVDAKDWRQVAETFIAARAAMTYLPKLHGRAETLAFIQHVVETQAVWVTDGLIDGKLHVVGFAALHGDWLDHLYVHPAMQGRGAGAALLDEVKTQRHQGFSLWTFQQNIRARQFYERHGLTLARTTDGRDNEEGLPDALYVWRGAGSKEDSS